MRVCAIVCVYMRETEHVYVYLHDHTYSGHAQDHFFALKTPLLN